MTFVNFGVKMMPEMDSSFLQEWFQMGPFPNKTAKSGHNEVQEGSRALKLLPNRVPGSKKRLQNGEVWQILSSPLG